VAWELGATNREELSEVQLAYLDKVTQKLLQVCKGPGRWRSPPA
jgi:hypothetical protein